MGGLLDTGGKGWKYNTLICKCRTSGRFGTRSFAPFLANRVQTTVVKSLPFREKKHWLNALDIIDLLIGNEALVFFT